MRFLDNLPSIGPMRRVWASLSLLLLLNSTALAQVDKEQAQIAMGSLFGLLKQDVLTVGNKDTAGLTVHAQYAAPLSVLQDSVARQLADYQRHRSNVEGLSAFEGTTLFAPFDSPTKVEAFINSLRLTAVSLTTQHLTDSGVPLTIAAAISERMPRKYLFDLEKALLSYAGLPKVTQTTFADAVNRALHQSSTAVLRPTVDYRATAVAIRGKLGITRAGALSPRYLEAASSQSKALVTKDLDELFDEATSAPPDLASVKQLVGDCLTKQAFDKFQELEVSQPQAANHALESLTRDILLRESTNATASSVAKRLTVDSAFDVLTKVSEFQELARDTAVHAREGAENVTAGLDSIHDVVDSNWNSLRQQASHITSLQAFSPPYVSQIGTTLHIMNDLTILTSGGRLDTTSLTELSSLAATNIPGAEGLAKLGPGLSMLTNAQTSFAQKGSALLGELAGLTNSDQLKQVSSAFSTVSSIMQTAGPLLALAGFASPFGGVALVGGLMGGGGPFGGSGGDAATAAALAAISKKLEEMDHKLDMIINKLDQLDRKISEQHVEVMNALESISFDVNRTRTGANHVQIEHYSSRCLEVEKIFKVPSPPIGTDADVFKTDFKDCQSNLKELNDGATKEFLKAVANLSTDDLKSTARHKLETIVAQHSESQQSAANNCFSLVLASYSVHELAAHDGVGVSDAKTDTQASLCNDVLSVGNMLDPGLLSLFSRLEWSSAYYSSNLTRTSAFELLWNDNSRQIIERRWSDELKSLNSAVGQQALLSGDVTLGNWAHVLNLRQPVSTTDRQVLDENVLLARNSVRYWMQNHLQATRPSVNQRGSDEFTSALQYAASYYSCSPNYLESLVELGNDDYTIVTTDFQKTKFKWTKAVRDQTSDPKFLVLDDKQNPPRPCPTRQGSSKRWCLLFEGLQNCIDLPTPDEMSSGELLRGDNLEALLNARDQVLTLLETTDLVAKYGDRLKLVAALGIQWRMHEKAQERQKQRQTEKQTPAQVSSQTRLNHELRSRDKKPQVEEHQLSENSLVRASVQTQSVEAQ